MPPSLSPFSRRISSSLLAVSHPEQPVVCVVVVRVEVVVVRVVMVVATVWCFGDRISTLSCSPCSRSVRSHLSCLLILDPDPDLG